MQKSTQNCPKAVDCWKRDCAIDSAQWVAAVALTSGVRHLCLRVDVRVRTDYVDLISTLSVGASSTDSTLNTRENTRLTHFVLSGVNEYNYYVEYKF